MAATLNKSSERAENLMILVRDGIHVIKWDPRQSIRRRLY